MINNNFIKRHNGPTEADVKKMLEVVGVESTDQLIDEIISPDIRLPKGLNIGSGLNEYECYGNLKALGAKNKIYRSYIGMGYYNVITPGVITRNILENPGWYTSYTPYQAEISQGRLEALLNYQTVISDMTAMPLANASLLDEATAASEAMLMFWHSRSRAQVKAGVNKFFVANDVFPHTVDVIKTRAYHLGIEVVVDDVKNFSAGEEFFGILVQCPNQYGRIINYSEEVKAWKEKGMQVAVASDLMSLALITPPGEWGADAVVGSSQRFGLPMAFGGPHTGFFATTDAYKREMPGRIIGISKDALGNPAYRLALQTREQHIKREKATSNICTAQALLGIMSGFYAIYHGAEGIREIARHINILACVLDKEMQKYGVKQLNDSYFDTLHFELPEGFCTCKVNEVALQHQMNFRIIDKQHFAISLDETTSLADVNEIVAVVCEVLGKEHEDFVCNPTVCGTFNGIAADMQRTSSYLQEPVFFKYRSETDMMRYMKQLEDRDLSLNRAMIPLGSCTMKLNSATSMFALSWPEFANIHPFVPADQAEGYLELINELGKDLCEITGFAGMSFMPNSGASGEYAGLLTIRRYQEANGQGHRNICLIPASAHGTNPASAAMAGMQVVVVKCDANGNIDMEDAKAKAEQYKDDLAAFMVTYPSTHGIYEDGIRDLMKIVHDNGGQVYMDGANMNAQVGLTCPGFIGADVCHLNLHKTFAIPHGGGGPGVGPIGVAAHLVPFLPTHLNLATYNEKLGAVSAAPYGSAQILTISYAYIKMLGGAGLREATKMAILNANYLKDRLKDYYPILYTGNNGHVAHEMILDINGINKATGVAAIDIAKRLMDYGFHAPTVAFPVHETLMVEPTESEPLAELDRFVDAMIKIRQEIADIESGKAERGNNLISHAPYTAEMLMADNWEFPFTRSEAGFPNKSDVQDKYFPHVTRIDDAFGDRNLCCRID